jgi:FtsP/CotA-like multicopper oxidase with cupredoxin domain
MTLILNGNRRHGEALASAVLAGWFLAASAAAQVESGAPQSCPYQIYGNELVQPREILPGRDNVLEFAWVARMLDFGCVPAFGLATCGCTEGNCPGGCVCPQGQTCPPAATACPGGQQWGVNKLPLRSWGTPIDPTKPFDPDDPDDPNITYGFPGPTLRVRAASGPGRNDGTRLKLRLHNRLPAQSYPADPNACNPRYAVEPPQPIGKADPQRYPRGQRVEQASPDCFHGDNVTNLHFHGTHVSPQEHQDFVLLALLPKGAKPPTQHAHGEEWVVGDYWYDIPPIRWDQDEGTHWYHPHKHGSTGEQVLNGMAGALIIEGPFDDWLNRLYGVTPQTRQRFEKVLVLQQVWPEPNFYNPNDHLAVYPPAALVNGQAQPVIKMRPGEIQRWRFVNATMQASAQLKLTPPPGVAWKQIAVDGTQFAPENYDAQPLYANPANTLPFSPGNRADFLVQAPAASGSYHFLHDVVGAVNARVRSTLDARGQALRQANGLPAVGSGDVDFGAAPLLTVVVEGEAVVPPQQFPRTAKTDPACAGSAPPRSCYPPLPEYLRDVEEREIVDRPTVAFSMNGTLPGQQPNTFWINGDGYDPDCAGETMVVDTAEQWTVSNDSPMGHPFHIHINPFQITRYAGQDLPRPWIWWDTVALPVPPSTADPQAPACDPKSGTACMTIRQRFRDFTGEYVIHCHILGHEDRGMMENVQVVCPKPREAEFGVPRAQGPECVEFRPAAPACRKPKPY